MSNPFYSNKVVVLIVVGFDYGRYSKRGNKYA